MMDLASTTVAIAFKNFNAFVLDKNQTPIQWILCRQDLKNCDPVFFFKTKSVKVARFVYYAVIE
ncbi:MAG: hypothetical protein UW42_C0010G0012 [Candidatus Collierbacteria bacterium GW2011_GWB1_44_197]|nr:MAG: hypothetical protein UW42_C0010G0012 [Candidatus Collierbacteria bacterium GW2011_GWB1_44_197]